MDKTLDYGIPAGSARPCPAHGVRPSPSRSGENCENGYVFEIKEQPSFTPVKPIAKVLSEQELIAPELFELALWIAKYYCAPLRQVLKAILPASVRGNGRVAQAATLCDARQNARGAGRVLREDPQPLCGSGRNSRRDAES